MDAQARSLFTSISDDQWNQLGYMDIANSAPSSLSTVVHPLLDFTWGGRDKWNLENSGLSEERTRYLLLPVLRFASRLLLSPASIRFLHAIFYGPRQKLQDLTAQLGGKHEQYSFQDLEDVDMNLARTEVERALKRLANYNVFEFANLGTDTMFQNAGARAMTRATKQIEEIDILEDDDRRGVAPRITLSPKFLTALEEAHSRPNNASHVLSATFNFGKIVFHEFQHAVDLVINSDVVK